MMNKTVVLGLLAGAFLVAPLMASVQPNDANRQRPFQKMINDLKLTPDQQAKLKAQHKQMREDGKQLFEQMKSIREKVKAELLKDKPSKIALDDYATQLAGLHKQLIQKRHEHLLQAKAILTPEQFAKLVNHEWQGPGGPEGERPYKGMGKGSCGRGMDDDGPDEK
jgi:Spy/CpxP family protein refolding chaperone